MLKKLSSLIFFCSWLLLPFTSFFSPLQLEAVLYKPRGNSSITEAIKRENERWASRCVDAKAQVEGCHLTLSDGSAWEIRTEDLYLLRDFEDRDPIYLYTTYSIGEDSEIYPFYLYNKTTGTYLKGRCLSVSPYHSSRAQQIDMYHRCITTDLASHFSAVWTPQVRSTSWEIPQNQLYLLENWQPNDCILLAKKYPHTPFWLQDWEAWWNNYYTFVIFNVHTSSFVECRLMN